MSTHQDKTQQAIDDAVSRALLLHLSPGGGSYGKGTTFPRAQRVVQAGVTEEILLNLMSAAATRAAEEAERTLSWALRDLLTEATKQAERSDSLSFHQYVERLKVRIAERGEDTPTEQEGTMSDKDTEILTGGLVKKQYTLHLDPEPWVTESGRRFTADLPSSGRVFEPRHGYEQDPSKYPGDLPLEFDPEPWLSRLDRVTRDATGGTLWDWQPRQGYQQHRMLYPEGVR